MKTYKLHLIRHGKTAANLDGRYIGRTDLPLSPLGEAELRSLRSAARYPAVDLVYSSPLARCRKTADILFPRILTLPVEGLRECDLGEFEGKSAYELRSNPSFGDWMRGEAPPGGESTADFTRRALEAFAGILDDLMRRKLGSAAVITHGGVIMSILGAVGLPRRPAGDWRCDPGCGYTLLADPAMWMRSGLCEVYRAIPQGPEEPQRGYGVYQVDTPME